MKQKLLSLYNGFTKTKVVLVLLALALAVWVVCFSGGSLGELCLFGLVVLGYVVLPGLFFARLLRVQKMVRGYLGPLALLFGAGFLMALYCVTMRLGILWLLHGLPPVLGAVGVGLWFWQDAKRTPAQKRRRWRAAPANYQWMLILLYAALVLLFAFYGPAKSGRPQAVGNVLLSQDMLWNIGNANSFKLAFPPQDIRFVGVRLHYHYLTELLAAVLSIVSGISCYNVIAFYLQPFMLAALVLCLFRFGQLVFKGRMLQALLLTYAPFLFSCVSLWKILPNGASLFSNANIIHLITNINSQSTAISLLCIFGGLFVAAARRSFRMGGMHWLSLLAAFFMLCFAKGPLAALVAIAACASLLVGLFLRKSGWRGLVLCALLGGLFFVIYTVMFASGANDSMHLSISGTIAKGWFYNLQNVVFHQYSHTVWTVFIFVLWVVQAFLSLPAAFPLFVCGALGDLRRFHKLPLERLFFNAAAVGGLAAFFLFDHPNMSQTYFLYTAIFFAELLAVANIDRVKGWWQAGFAKGSTARALKKGWSRLMLGGVALCAAVGVATTGFLYVHMLGSGARQILRNMGLSEKYPYALVVTAEDEAAMQWLGENSEPDALFTTNRIHTGPTREGISNVYSAFSGRQGYIEGFQYARSNMGVPVDEIVRRLDVNGRIFSAETPPEDIPAICREEGIDYVVFSTQMNGIDVTDTQLSALELCWDTPDIRIYRVPEA